MTDTANEIIRKRMDLKNSIDQAAAKQRDLNYLNEKIEKETRELRLLEMILKVDRAVEDLNNYPDDFRKSMKTCSIEKLKILYKDLNNEEISMLHERIRL